jgi:putative sterol carrier protein
MADSPISEFMSRMGTAFNPEKAAGIDGSIQLTLTGNQPDEWFITIKDNQCTINQGMATSPNLTVSAESVNLMKIFSGELDGMQAFLQGKLRIKGDINLAMKLMNLFKVQ